MGEEKRTFDSSKLNRDWKNTSVSPSSDVVEVTSLPLPTGCPATETEVIGFRSGVGWIVASVLGGVLIGTYLLIVLGVM